MGKESIYREYKMFTRDRIRELILECEQNVDECVRLVDMLLLDAQDMSDAKAVANATAALDEISKQAESARSSLRNLLVV